MWYHGNLKDLLFQLETTERGLTSAQAEQRLAQNGKNRLSAPNKKGFIAKFFAALLDRMTIVLLIAAAISFATAIITGDGFADPVIILIIVMANAVIAVIQENRAERALEALKRMSSPETTVIRDGRPKRIPSEDLTVGDVFLLEKGDIVPCDARLLSSNRLLVDESALTGESAGVHKNHKSGVQGNAPISEIANSVFTSSHVISGRATAVAVKTGMETCVGEIANMLTADSEQTPLQKRLAKLSLALGNLTIFICLGLFVFSLLKGMAVGEMFVTSVSLSVAAIPEGLPAIVTVVLSAGVQTMARRRAVVKRLPAVETLGCAQIICSDKTGTLTCNKMAVTQIYGNKEELIKAFALCNNDSSPTELALTDYVSDFQHYRSLYPRVDEIPFDSVKKYMVTVNKDNEGYTVYIKGAPDIISAYCPQNKDEITAQTQLYASEALRVMGFAKYRTNQPPHNPLNGRFEFLGLCGISDPPRPEAAEAIKVCKKAGIRTIMITGDHKDTARAIAIKLGITDKNGLVYTEKELNGLNDREFLKIAEKCNVFARVTPSFKLRIVSALKQKGYVVAMTGDGVNDAPALKKADIGCAMGISGTEVAKESADMILTDDNFSTVVSAVREGRGIYENIRRAVHFLLSCNIGELFTVFFAIIVSLPSPLSAIQLLWVNLTTDSLPAIALGLEKASDSLMERHPVKPNAPLFSAHRIFRIVFEGILIGSLAISAFVIGNNLRGFTVGRTMCFLVLAVSQLFHSFNMRTEKSIFSGDAKPNPFVWLAFGLCFALQSSVIIIPAAANLFGVTALTLTEWAVCISLSVCPIAVCEVYKKLKQ